MCLCNFCITWNVAKSVLYTALYTLAGGPILRIYLILWLVLWERLSSNHYHLLLYTQWWNSWDNKGLLLTTLPHAHSARARTASKPIEKWWWCSEMTTTMYYSYKRRIIVIVYNQQQSHVWLIWYNTSTLQVGEEDNVERSVLKHPPLALGRSHIIMVFIYSSTKC